MKDRTTSGKCCCCSVAKSCPTFCWWDYSPSTSSLHGVFQARILEWVAISFSRGSSWMTDWTCVSSNGKKILLPLSHHGSPQVSNLLTNSLNSCNEVFVRNKWVWQLVDYKWLVQTNFPDIFNWNWNILNHLRNIPQYTVYLGEKKKKKIKLNRTILLKLLGDLWWKVVVAFWEVC